MMTEEGKIQASLENRTDKYERFTTPFMSEIMPDAVGCQSGWRTENFYFYEIRNKYSRRSDDHEVFLELSINLKNLPVNLKEASDRMCQVIPADYETKEFRGYFITDHVFFKENTDQDTVMKQLELFFNQVQDFEKRIKEGLGIE